MSKIEDIELYRDGGSFEFVYEDEDYKCMTPLFMIEDLNGVIIDFDKYKEILVKFDEYLKDAEENPKKIMSGRFMEAKKAFSIINKYQEAKNKDEAEDLE